jgi:hypothetical protein
MIYPRDNQSTAIHEVEMMPNAKTSNLVSMTKHPYSKSTARHRITPQSTLTRQLELWTL